MRRTNKTVGTGITKRAVVTFDQNNPVDVDELILAGILTFDRTSFDRLSQRIVSHAEQILTKAGLPTDADGLYVISGAKSWTRVKQDRRSKRAMHQGLFISELVLQLGYESDSPEGYAARILSMTNVARRLYRAGQLDEAMAMAFGVGELINEAGMKEILEPDALRGEKVLESARLGHAHVHGTEQAKAARRDAYVRAFRKCVAEGLHRMAAYEEVAKEYRVSPRTIQRAVELSDG